jgi:hypothetical protein
MSTTDGPAAENLRHEGIANERMVDTVFQQIGRPRQPLPDGLVPGSPV